jgi:SAM-dependent methyltransferase
MISLFTPTHNPRYLLDAYRSIEAQPFDEWVILANGVGRDAIPAEILADDRVKLYLAPGGEGYVGALKAHACSLCRGDILVELDHDDLLTPTAIADIHEAFADESVGFVYSNSANFEGDFKATKPYNGANGWQFRPYDHRGHTLNETRAFSPTPSSVSTIWFAPNHVRAWRRTVYEQIGGHNPKMRVLDDQDILCRTYLATQMRHIDKCLYLYRIDGNNTWLRHNKEIQDNCLRIHDQYIERLAGRWADVQGLAKLNLGGRFDRREGWQNVDLKDADVCCDLNRPWPFADNSVGAIVANDVLEHLPDKLHVIREAYRVEAAGGYLLTSTPSTDGRGAFQDPTHSAYYNENSFLYYTDAALAKYIDTPVRFQAKRLYTTEKTKEGVCWVVAHLISLKDGHRPPGLCTI